MAQDWSGKPGAVLLRDGRTLSYLQYGDPRGIPCVLIHDTPGTARSAGWLLHGVTTPANIRFIAIDRVGWGSSGDLNPGETPQQVRALEADAIARLVQVLALRAVPVIGIGTGALVAMAVADAHPQIVTSVSCLSPRLPLNQRPGGIAGWRMGRAAIRRDTSLPFLPGIADIPETAADWAELEHRMDPKAKELIGKRWQDAKFRFAYQQDAEATLNSAQYGRQQLYDRVDAVVTLDPTHRFDGPVPVPPVRVFASADDPHLPAVRRWFHGRAEVAIVETDEPVLATERWPAVLGEAFAPQPLAV